MFSAVQLSWSFDGAVDFSLPPSISRCESNVHKSWDSDLTWLYQWARTFRSTNFSPLLSDSEVKWRKKENEKSEPEIPCAVIHTDVDGIACKRFIFGGKSGRRLTVDCRIKKHTAKNETRAANEIQRINKYNCFLSDGNTSKFIQRGKHLEWLPKHLFVTCRNVRRITRICFNNDKRKDVACGGEGCKACQVSFIELLWRLKLLMALQKSRVLWRLRSFWFYRFNSDSL